MPEKNSLQWKMVKDKPNFCSIASVQEWARIMWVFGIATSCANHACDASNAIRHASTLSYNASCELL
eukprot:1516565-Karenia_brevis.AAC.1